MRDDKVLVLVLLLVLFVDQVLDVLCGIPRVQINLEIAFLIISIVELVVSRGVQSGEMRGGFLTYF